MVSNPFLAAAMGFISAGIIGGIVQLIRVRPELRKTDAETGLTNTEAAAQLSESWAKLVAALDQQLTNASTRAASAEQHAAEAEARAERAERSMAEMEDRMRRMQAQIVQLEHQLAAARQTPLR